MSLVLVFYFHCISMYCLGCHNHSSHSLFIGNNKKTICKMTTLYTEPIFKMTTSFGNNLRTGRTNDFPWWHSSNAICKSSPHVCLVCVHEWKYVIKDLNLTRQEYVSFVYPVTRASLPASMKLFGTSCLLYSERLLVAQLHLAWNI